MKYIKDEHSKVEGCVFCQKINESDDKENLIIHRANHVFTIMNLYPYNNGHLMIVPNRHTKDFESLTDEENSEINLLLKKCTKAMTKSMNAQGFNIGINIGQIAGAGIAEHLHWHIVPRWEADTNFMPVITDTRVIPQALEDTYILLKNAIEEINE